MYYMYFCLKNPYLIHSVDSSTLNSANITNSCPNMSLGTLGSTSLRLGAILNREITSKNHKN